MSVTLNIKVILHLDVLVTEGLVTQHNPQRVFTPVEESEYLNFLISFLTLLLISGKWYSKTIHISLPFFRYYLNKDEVQASGLG